MTKPFDPLTNVTVPTALAVDWQRSHDMKLYYSPGACSLAVHVALEKIGGAHDVVAVPVREGAHLTPEYLAVNPRARVPALEVDGRVLTEVLAILLYLDELHPEAALLPRARWERARALEWMSYASSTLHPLYRALWRTRWFSEDEALHAGLAAGADRRLVELFGEIDAALGGTTFLIGERATVADYYLYVFARWGSVLSVPSERRVNLWRWMQRVAALPEVARTAAREQIEVLRR